MFGNRGIYHKGWTAVTRHRTPWVMTGQTPPFDDDVWELYDTTKDWSQAHDLSKEMPDKLHELQRLWIIEATRNNVLADGRPRSRAVQLRSRGPSGARFAVRSRFSPTAWADSTRTASSTSRTRAIRLPRKSSFPKDTVANGVILSQGGIGGGWMFYVKDGMPTYLYNFVGLRSIRDQSRRSR